MAAAARELQGASLARAQEARLLCVVAGVASPSYTASATSCQLSFWVWLSGPQQFYLYPTLTHSVLGILTQLDRLDTTLIQDAVWTKADMQEMLDDATFMV